MMCLPKWIIVTAVLAGIVFFGLIESSRMPLSPRVVHVSTMLDPAFFENAYAKAPALSNIPRSTSGIILPHHLLAAPLIAGALNQFSVAPRRIVIVGPDHLHRARAAAVMTTGAWKTPFGILEADHKITEALTKDGLVEIDEPVFDVEHSIAALVPFLKRSFPNAKITSLLVNERLTPDQADAIAKRIPRDALVIASVDFSHYLPNRVAQFHDQTSRAVLESFAFDDISELEVDSPASLRVLLRAMEVHGSERMTLLANENSATLTRNFDLPETTSYVLAAFSSGASDLSSVTTVLAVGDMMFDRNVRKHMEHSGMEYPFAHIRGTEDRFFRGIDIMTGNLEGAIGIHAPPAKEIDFAFDASVTDLLRQLGFDAVNLANNHSLDQGRDGFAATRAALVSAGIGFFGDQVRDDGEPWVAEVRGKNIAMLGFNVTDNQLDEPAARAALERAARENDLVIVQVHWGAEYVPRPTASQRELGRKLVDWGADAVIGHHPHWMQGLEVWRGRPIFWSLGNFIFDQYWSAETQRGLAVGLAFTENGAIIYLFPIISEKSQPRLAVGEEDQKLLQLFVERSDLPEDLQAEAERGKLDLIFE